MKKSIVTLLSVALAGSLVMQANAISYNAYIDAAFCIYSATPLEAGKKYTYQLSNVDTGHCWTKWTQNRVNNKTITITVPSSNTSGLICATGDGEGVTAMSKSVKFYTLHADDTTPCDMRQSNMDIAINSDNGSVSKAFKLNLPAYSDWYKSTAQVQDGSDPDQHQGLGLSQSAAYTTSSKVMAFNRYKSWLPDRWPLQYGKVYIMTNVG